MASTSTEAVVYGRAKAIAEGLVRTRRAEQDGVIDRGMVKLTCRKGGYYWISFDGGRVLRGAQLFEAEELQPKFIDAMERAGR
jgi:hypothetical protein